MIGICNLIGFLVSFRKRQSTAIGLVFLFWKKALFRGTRTNRFNFGVAILWKIQKATGYYTHPIETPIIVQIVPGFLNGGFEFVIKQK